MKVVLGDPEIDFGGIVPSARPRLPARRPSPRHEIAAVALMGEGALGGEQCKAWPTGKRETLNRSASSWAVRCVPARHSARIWSRICAARPSVISRRAGTAVTAHDRRHVRPFGLTALRDRRVLRSQIRRGSPTRSPRRTSSGLHEADRLQDVADASLFLLEEGLEGRPPGRNPPSRAASGSRPIPST